MELSKGDLVNLGVGIPSDVASIVSEAGYIDEITMTTEIGGFGGIPASLPNFGSSYNAEANIDHGSMFDLYDGGGIDIAILGLAQADEEGNINVSKFTIPGLGARLTGPGGFINITQSTQKVVFAGSFNAKCEVEVRDGKLIIKKEGKGKKLLKAVEQITFSGKYAAEKGQEILYVTERCVFKLINGKMTVIEVAPGINLEKDILNQMDFRPEISDNLKEMDPGLFSEKWDGLDTIMGK